MMKMKHFPYMFEEKPNFADSTSSHHPADAHYITTPAHANPPGRVHRLRYVKIFSVKL